MARPTNSDNIIDSRDVVRAIGEVREEIEALGPVSEDEDTEREDLTEELARLESLNEEGGTNASDWTHGATLIKEDHFEDYARQLAEDIGAIKRDMDWPCNCIDWEKAARELRTDYTEITFGDETYLVRS